CARRARAPRSADDARGSVGDRCKRRVPQWAVLHELSRRDAVGRGGLCMSVVLSEPTGTITVTSVALAGLVVQAAEAVDGVQVRRRRRRLDIDVALGEAKVRLELTARYGLVLPDVAREVQERVADALVTMCGVSVGNVDISVEEVE